MKLLCLCVALCVARLHPYSVLQCVASCCSVLHHVAVCCSVLHSIAHCVAPLHSHSHHTPLVRALSLSPPPLRTRLEREGGHWLKKIKEGKRKFRSSPSHPGEKQGKKEITIKKGKWNLARPHHGPKNRKKDSDFTTNGVACVLASRQIYVRHKKDSGMGWLRLVGSLKS